MFGIGESGRSEVGAADPSEAPAFGQPSYAFDLAENTDSSTAAIALGTVSASDPENATPPAARRHRPGRRRSNNRPDLALAPGMPVKVHLRTLHRPSRR